DLEAALDGVRRVGVGDYRFLAVDDGSTDRPPRILRSWAALVPLRMVSRSDCGNWVAASNAALREARGRYACFLHQDDLWLPGRLAALEREVEAGPSLVVHPAVFIGPDARRLGPWHCPLPEGNVDAALFAERLSVQNFIAIPAAAFDLERALRLGAMDESLWYTA